MANEVRLSLLSNWFFIYVENVLLYRIDDDALFSQI